jgi:hypothetical protein
VSALTWSDLASWVPSGKTSDLTYYRAGAQLVRYLVETFGVQQLMQHYRAARSSAVPAEVESDFSDSFGMSMADAWAAALELDLPGGPCLTPFECSHEPLALGNSWQVRGACGVGYASRTLELTVDTSLLLSTAGGVPDHRGERDSSDMLVACDGKHAFPTWTMSREPPSLATRLEAGTYALILPLPAAEAAVTLTTTPAGLVADCSASADQTLPIADDTLQLAVPLSGETWYARLAADGNPSVEAFFIDQVRAPARLCASCDADSPCTDVTAETKETDIATMPVLEVNTESRREGFTLLTVQPQ